MKAVETKTKPDINQIFRQFLLIVILGAAGGQLSAAERTARPNILFVIADQWRAQAFGFADDPNVRTPHLDTLRQESIDFVNAISSMPVCCPARASFMTGQRALTHGVFMNDVPLNPGAATIAKVLDRADYNTGYIGKWHLNGDGRSAFIPRERRQGFDYWKALECTHSYNHSYYYADGPEKLEWKGYDAVAQTSDAQTYLRDHAKSDKPFCLFLSWGPPHDPYQTAPAKYRAMYHADEIKLRPNVPEADREQARQKLAGYYAHCTALDDCIGELMETLQETGLADNTIVVFTADHGALLGSHGAYHKQQPYDESIRVPLLIRWPDRLGTLSITANAMISTEDIMPTLLGLCGVTIPNSVEGQDYSGYLRGGKSPSDGAKLISCVAPFGEWDRRAGGREYRGIRTMRYTYVRDLNGPWLLFDNETDPYQTNNLVNAADSGKLQKDLDATLTRKLKAADDQFLPASDYIKQWGYTVNQNGTVPYTN